MSGQDALELARAHGGKVRLNAAGDGLLLEMDGDPPPNLVELLRAAKPELVERLRLLKAVEVARPPDVTDAQWKVAVEGLRAFLAGGHGDEAERLGWPKAELYRVPKLWSQISLTGAGLLIGDAEVVEITAARIGIKTLGGASQAFYRRPEIDWAVVYRARLKLSGLDAVSEEPQLRALEFAVREYRRHHGVDLKDAKAAVLAAIAAKEKMS
jgi:hypothetical protein